MQQAPRGELRRVTSSFNMQHDGGSTSQAMNLERAAHMETDSSRAMTGTVHYARVDDPDVELPPFPSMIYPMTGMCSNGQPLNDAALTRYTVAEFMTVEMRPGFCVERVITGFESSTIQIDGVGEDIPLKYLSQALGVYGALVGVHRKSVRTVLARYVHSKDATAASAAWDGKSVFGGKVHAKSVAPRDISRLTLNDATVRIVFDLPTKVIYGGYQTLAQAEVGISRARQGIRHHVPSAEHHKSVPAVSNFTVKFVGLPADVKQSEVSTLGSPVDQMFERPNYFSSPAKVGASLERHFRRNRGLVRFALQSPPYYGGVAKAWAMYSSATEAKAVCAAFDGTSPGCTGGTRIQVQQICSVLYDIDMILYSKNTYAIHSLAVMAQQGGMDMTFAQQNGGRTLQVRMEADNLQAVNYLRMELEHIVRGEVLRDHGKVIWHPFFIHPEGRAFVRRIEGRLPHVSIMADGDRQQIRVSATRKDRAEVFRELRAQVGRLTKQQSSAIPLSGDAVGLYLDPDIAALRARFGNGCMMLDTTQDTLIIYGSDVMNSEAATAVHRAKQRRCEALSDPRSCPVCFAEADTPITLGCGHSWCSECIRGFLVSCGENRIFPIGCLGSSGRCRESITHQTASAVLSEVELDRLVQAAFTAYVNARPDEFHYCPTPDCKQVYRSVGRGRVLQCPACLLRICSLCQSEFHGTLRCNADDGAAELEEWMKANGVQRCPGCKAPIERSGGCHHVTCTQCQTHICWQCMETFPGGDGIYGHMRTEHGTWGMNDE
ncbi:uncharacterized protein SCHCODRAFT_01169155 [Schizophyllum commune H4-8]|uniref:uncharacterized protein n=1 Tax=Schizophyllum commune (strain H4-8 / FGSC 9210) TaxID=578458 RepID=UPI002160A146|nr:uncharacterized protein SCHCODRAFT_01169155 [Schizophyllum commune H4-8]KAI5894460.1 hypothetical protein SCHCODRAFT_01169155 [Schizophyllum commune H4-8]